MVLKAPIPLQTVDEDVRKNMMSSSLCARRVIVFVEFSTQPSWGTFIINTSYPTDPYGITIDLWHIRTSIGDKINI